MTHRSFKPEVKVRSEQGWHSNGMRFASYSEAQAQVRALEQRWVLVTDTRVAESMDPVNYKWSTEQGATPVEVARAQA